MKETNDWKHQKKIPVLIHNIALLTLNLDFLTVIYNPVNDYT